MKQLLSLILKPHKPIEEIREEFGVDISLIKPHITLVYPFKVPDQKELYEHITQAIRKIPSFEITLEGLQKSAKEFYLYLLVHKGKEQVIKLHKSLRSGMLADFDNPNMPEYIPHLSLGSFENKEAIDAAMQKAEAKKISFTTTIAAVQLLTINECHELVKVEEFSLH